MYYPCSENKGADQLRSYCEADLRLCFRLCRSLVFLCGSSIIIIPVHFSGYEPYRPVDRVSTLYSEIVLTVKRYDTLGTHAHAIYTWTSLQQGSLQHGFGYNTDHCWTPISHFRQILLYVYTFFSRYKMEWIANTKIGLDPNNSVIKRLRCTNNF